MDSDKDRSTYQDKMYLEDIGPYDLEMTKDAVKNARKHSFGRNRAHAISFIRDCMDRTLKYVGINIEVPEDRSKKDEYGDLLEAELFEKQIKIERRKDYRGDDVWRCGFYIYQKDVLVAFISEIMVETKTQTRFFKIVNQDVNYFVITNAPGEDRKLIYLMGDGPKVVKSPAAMIPGRN